MRSIFRLGSALLLAALPYTLGQDSASSSTSSTSSSSLAAALALLQSLPQCALNCLTTQVAASTCALTDETCVCSNTTLQENISICVAESCTITESLFAKNVTDTICHVPVESKRDLCFILTVTFGVISAAAVLARISYKAFVAQLNWDDWFILITLFSGIPSTVINAVAVIPNGLGRNIWTLTPTMITNFGMFFYVMAVLYFLQVTLLKMSMLFFYMRIFPDRKVKRLLLGTVWFNTVFGLFFVVLTIFQCQPVPYYWTKWDGTQEGKCLSINIIAWANAGVSIALGIWILAIPLSQLRKLQMHWKKKIGVVLMFIVGAFVEVVSILRLQSLVVFADTQNPTWDYVDVLNWSVVEINVGIICACMPTLRVILVRIFPALGGTTRAGQYYQSGSFGTAGFSKGGGGRSRAGKGGAMPAIAHHNVATPGAAASNNNKAIIYQQRTYTVQYGDSDEESLVQMQNLDFNGAKQAGSAKELNVI